MSSINWSHKDMTVIWTNTNYIGLTEEWVKELVGKGYKFIDKRKKMIKLDLI